MKTTEAIVVEPQSSAIGDGSSVTSPCAESQRWGGSQDFVRPGGWYTLWTALVLTLFAFVDRQLLTLAAEPISKSLSLSDTELGMVQGLAFSVFTVVAVYPIAWLADRFDRRFVLGGCVLAWSLGTAACGFVRDFHELFAAAVLIAAGEAGLTPLIMAVVPDLFGGRKRLVANGIQYFAAYVGISIALVLGGLALTGLDRFHPSLPSALGAWDSWRIAFLTVVLPTPLLLLAIAFMKLPRPRGVGRGGGASLERVVGEAPDGIGGFLQSHWVATACVIGSLGLYLLAFGGFFVWLPVACARLFGATPADNGSGMGLASGLGMLAGVAISTLVVRRLMPRIGRVASVRVAWWSMLLTVPVLPSFAFVAATWHAYAAMGVLMVSGTAIGVLVPTMLQEMTSSDIRARFFALYAIASALLSGASASLVGLVSDMIGGERGLLYALSGVALLAWIGATLLMRVSERHFVVMAEAAAQRGTARNFQEQAV